MHFKFEYIIYIIIGLVWLFNNLLSSKEKGKKNEQPVPPVAKPSDPTDFQEMIERWLDPAKQEKPQVETPSEKRVIRESRYEPIKSLSSEQVFKDENTSYEKGMISNEVENIQNNINNRSEIKGDDIKKQEISSEKKQDERRVGLIDLRQAFIHSIILERPYK